VPMGLHGEPPINRPPCAQPTRAGCARRRGGIKLRHGLVSGPAPSARPYDSRRCRVETFGGRASGGNSPLGRIVVPLRRLGGELEPLPHRPQSATPKPPGG
jgi:hypothetical protein